MFNTVDDDTSNFFMVAICRPGLIGGEAAASHHTSTAQTHTHHPSRQEEKFREAATNSGKRRPLPNKTQLRVPKQYTTSNPRWPNAAYQCPLFWLLKLAGELLLNLATSRLNQVGFLSIRAYDSDWLQALSLILLLVKFCQNVILEMNSAKMNWIFFNCRNLKRVKKDWVIFSAFGSSR